MSEHFSASSYKDIKEPPIPVNEQMRSPSYRIASLDRDYLLSDSMRGIRFMLEYCKTEEILQHNGIRSTIVVFGSARTRENGTERQKFWYDSARAFGRLASLEGGAMAGEDGIRDNVIATGGGPGIMEAANRGAHDAGAPSIGYNITLPHEQQPNDYSTPELTFNFHYFAMRKLHFSLRANALVVFPGGFGTFDELFELLTLCQTRRARRIPIVLFDRAYWTSVINFQSLVDYGMISPSDTSIFSYAETATDIWRTLTTGDMSVLAPESTTERMPPWPKHGEVTDLFEKFLFA